LVGTTSPYPTVVTVCKAHHMPSPTLSKSCGSMRVISEPPSRTLSTVAETMTPIPLRTDAGVRRKASS
jgi:hypothetical protein